MHRFLKLDGLCALQLGILAYNILTIRQPMYLLLYELFQLRAEFQDNNLRYPVLMPVSKHKIEKYKNSVQYNASTIFN